VYGNRHSCKGLLLRVRRRRQDISQDATDVHREVGDSQNASEKSQATSSSSMLQYSAELIGVVETVYRFES